MKAGTRMHIKEPSAQQFKEIIRLIAQFELDDRNLLSSQFLAALSEETLSGFGRIREYAGCSELCSLGVVEPQRHKGIGRQLVQKLCQKTRQPLFLVCIIPEFFEPLGFEMTTQYPPELQQKLDYCRLALSVPEEYVVMKYEQVVAD
jgi:N-acetylglutamate synthase-like GNAT family acetyltransferase